MLLGGGKDNWPRSCIVNLFVHRVCAYTPHTSQPGQNQDVEFLLQSGYHSLAYFENHRGFDRQYLGLVSPLDVSPRSWFGLLVLFWWFTMPTGDGPEHNPMCALCAPQPKIFGRFQPASLPS